jgi:DNA-binding XRE family transcriptional regulator
MSKRGSKYHPLQTYLRERGADGVEEVTLTFAQIELLLGAPLPHGARIDPGWWGNRRRSSAQAAAWLGAGYRVRAASLAHKRVIFESAARRPAGYVVRRDGDTVVWDAALIKALRAHMDLSQAAFAEHMGVRQQTVSEWETSAYAPTRATCKHLSLVAERAGFDYGDSHPHE